MFVIGSSEGKESVIAEECEVVKKNGEVTRKNGRGTSHTLPSETFRILVWPNDDDAGRKAHSTRIVELVR